MILTLNIPIPQRKNTPKTSLFVKVCAENEKSLKTKPYIFMLPGGPGANHSHYKEYCCLTDIGNIVFYDPRGCGLSEKGELDTYTMSNYIQDIEIIRQYLSLNEIILLGKSYGAVCALGYTLKFPQVVSKLILAAGSASFRNLDTAKKYVAAHGTNEQKRAFELLINGQFSSDEEMNHYFFVMDTFYSYKRRHGKIQPHSKPEYPFAYQPLNQGFQDFLHSFDFEDELDQIKCETLVLVGEEDWIMAKEHSELLADKISGSKLLIFPKADHSLELDVPEAFFWIYKRIYFP